MILTSLLHKLSSPLLTFIVLISFSSSVISQDTTWVQTFDYQSKTRDTMISFPQGDHNQYEKIIMYYSMRCKNGLISTGADRNRGCGEWDYSCNTNVVDSSGIDSLKALHPNYVINGITEDYFFYTTKPTFTYYEYEQTNVNITSSTNKSYFPVASGTQSTNILYNDNKAQKAYYFIKASDVSGLTQGAIAGLRFDVVNPGSLGFMKIKIARTTASSINPETIQSATFEQVVNREVSFPSVGTNDVVFHKSFAWNGSDNFIIEISHTSGDEQLLNFTLKGSSSPSFNGYTNSKKDSYIEFNTQASLEIPTTSMSNIKSQITIAFWSKGNANVLPANNSIFHAVDNNNNRQLNVHLPWSDGRVYWDCGNDGSGYDRIDKPALVSNYEGSWQHWTFTKNTGTGSMKIYLNGVLWHSANGKNKPIDIKKFNIGSDNNLNVPYHGGVDDFTVWDKELTAAEIKAIMFQSAQTLDNLSQNLVAYYNLNDGENQTITDKSVFGATATIKGNPEWRSFRGADIFKGFEPITSRPEMAFIKGNFSLQSSDVAVRDSIMNTPNKVTAYSVVNNSLVEGNTVYYWASGIFPVYNEDGEIIDEVEVMEEDIIFIEDLIYYNKFPSVFELMSFVTPYGIGLDFGLSGKTWLFDMTDFGPILKNSKRFYMDKGGEWQEEIDIRFAFIKGTPVRNVQSIQPIWPVASYGYTSILNNAHLEARTLATDANVKSMKVRVTTTGHGQEGEFIPRNHSINVNGGSSEFSWQVWKECSENPVYPQGGTWVYDRAGWCPGEPSVLNEYEIMPFVTSGSPFTIDYGLNTASGDSRYIIATQLVKYGDINFQNDAAILTIVSPSSNVQYERVNPVCASSEVIIRNNGSNVLTSVDIWYGIEGQTLKKYTWTGNLKFLQTANVVLPNLPASEWQSGNRFIAYTSNPNNTQDQYQSNDKLVSNFIPSDHLDGDIIISMRTNSQPQETSWTLKNDAGNIVLSSKPNLQPNTTYQDTVRGLSGCFKLQFLDSDDDGISWWANGDGNGFIRIKSGDSGFLTFNPDFGGEFTYNFTTGIINSVDDLGSDISINIHPNPTSDQVSIDIKGVSGQTGITIFNHLGYKIYGEVLNNIDIIGQTAKIDLTSYPSGIYHVQIENDGKVKTNKIVKI